MAEETPEERMTRLYQEYIARGKQDPFVGDQRQWIIVDRLLDVVLAYVKGPVVEIGVGHSTLVLSKHAEKFGVPFLTCDVKKGRCDWVEAVVKYGGLKLYRGKSYHFLKELQEAGIRVAVAFVDGDHHYSTLKMEVDALLPLLLPGGMMFMHDTCPVPFRYEQRLLRGVKVDTHLVRKELEKRDDVDVLTWRYTAAECGLTMVLKKDMSEPEYRI